MKIIASGLTTIQAQLPLLSWRIFFKEKVEAVIIGEPIQMNGQPSESASIVKGFVTFTNHFRIWK
jgi:putative Holliday junction resolvase